MLPCAHPIAGLIQHTQGALYRYAKATWPNQRHRTYVGYSTNAS